MKAFWLLSKTGLRLTLVLWSTLTVLFLTADRHELLQALGQLSYDDSATLSGLIAACKSCEALKPAERASKAWMLWEHAVTTAQPVNSSAQEALWHTQSGWLLTLSSMSLAQASSTRPVF